MSIDVNDSKKLVTVWLSNDEMTDESFSALCNAYRSRKYNVFTIRSGKGDLLNNTTNLLLHNNRLM